jgi:DNA-binding GntR family transcriptional regulator
VTAVRRGIPRRGGSPRLVRGRKAGTAHLFSDLAYERIKELIITTKLPPGALLTEGELAGQLGLGRMPVREAMQRLAQDDLVMIVPRKGSFVLPVQVEDLQKIFELRVTLECLSCQLAAERITDEELKKLEAMFENVDSLDEGSEEHVRIDRAFHRAVAAATRNEYLQRAVERTLNLAVRLLYVSGSRMAKVGEIAGEYRRVLDALRRRDGRAASEAMRAHIEEFRKKVRSAV